MDRTGAVDEQEQERQDAGLESSSRDERATCAAPLCPHCSYRGLEAPLSDAPEDIIESVLSWLNERDVAIAMIVSSRWKRIGGSDFTWLPLYTRRFGVACEVPEQLRQVKSGETCGALPSGSPDPVALSYGAGDGLVRFAFRSRLACPIAGDTVQVAWHGKFRLDSCMVFIGFSWWDAEVLSVDLEDSDPPCTLSEGNDSGNGDRGGGCTTDDEGTHGSGGGEGVEGDSVGGARRPFAVGERRAKGFLVHYLLWGRRWDEWIEPSRIRWARRIHSVESCNQMREEPELRVDQQAELWCHGDGDGGAWLDVRVYQISHTLVCLSDRMLNSHVRWVARDRVRPKSTAPRSIAEIAVRAYGGCETDDADEDTGGGERGTGVRESRKRLGVCRSFPTLFQISRRNEILDRAGYSTMRKAKGGSCCTM